MESVLAIVVKSQLVRDLTRLGVCSGQVIMLHASVRAVGWIVGGPEVVLDALLDVLGSAGTFMMYVSWEEDIEDFYQWSLERQAAYLAECPPFDPATSRAHRKWSILTEYLRTRVGSFRSGNPGASVAAFGAKAQWLTQDHPLQFGYSPGLPLAKLCEAGGKVLMLGAPLDTVTLLHYSEHMADIPNKRMVHYKVPLLQGEEQVWIEVEEYDTSRGIGDWEGGNYFMEIVREYLAAGYGRKEMVGAAPSYLFDAPALHNFALEWMERMLVA